MVAIIFGLVVILAIYFSQKAKDEKQLRKKQELELKRARNHTKKIEEEKKIISKNQKLLSMVLDIEKPITEHQYRQERTKVKYDGEIHAKVRFKYYYSKIISEEILKDYTSEKEIKIYEHPAPRDSLIIEYQLSHRWPYKISRESVTIKNVSTVKNEEIIKEYQNLAKWCKNNLKLID